MRIVTIFLSLLMTIAIQAQPIVPQVYKQNLTLTYKELINEYEKLANVSPKAKLFTYGKTDIGLPLQLFVISDSKQFDAKLLRSSGKRIVLINNGIHPGEPAGIEASLQLVARLLNKNDSISKVLESTVVCVIPTYNIGGMLNRSAYNRANQNGPEECGFRGNARNMDLNRDFISCNTENNQKFLRIFHEWKPDVFLDTHTTDGSDHQNTLTLVTTAHQDLPPSLGKFLDKKMRPELYKMMEEKSKYLMSPYVTVWRKAPDDGFQMFVESPRYSTGFTSLFNTLSFMTENHIFKSFEDRVVSTLDFMHCLLSFTHENAKQIGELRQKANKELKEQKQFVLDWKIDSSKYDLLKFHGFEASYIPSKLTGEPLLHYDRDKPYTKELKYFNVFNPKTIVQAPKYYIIPQAWKEVVKRLKYNKVDMERLTEDVALKVNVYFIDDYETTEQPYNGHYLHSNIEVIKKARNIQYYKGDYIVPVKGKEKHFLIQVLEPHAPDSYFAWNMFDEILQSREYFSPFIFEERALQILDTTPGLKEKLEIAIEENPKLAKDTYGQMKIIYQNSPYFEDTYKRYPVARIEEKTELPVIDSDEY